jgi:hypothetical protein
MTTSVHIKSATRTVGSVIILFCCSRCIRITTNHHRLLLQGSACTAVRKASTDVSSPYLLVPSFVDLLTPDGTPSFCSGCIS